MQEFHYHRLDHDVRDSTPIRIKHDLWNVRGPGLRDMHYEVELGVVLTGEMRREHDGWRSTFKPGSLWLGGIWEPHSAEVVCAPLELVMFHVQPDMLAQLRFPEAPHISWLRPFTLPPDERPHPLEAGKDRWLWFGEKMKALGAREESWQVKVQSRLLLLELLVEIIGYMPAGPADDGKPWHKHMSRAIELALVSNTRVPVGEAANAVGMNRIEFSRAFRSLTGIGFKEFQLHHRLRVAAAELHETDTPIKTIAQKMGFVDKCHFHHHFFTAFGCTPNDYRKRSRSQKAEAFDLPQLAPSRKSAPKAAGK